MVLAVTHPNGLTLEELLNKAMDDDPSQFHSLIGLKGNLGIINDERDGDSRGVVCWKMVDGKIYYDMERKAYAPTSDSFGFALYFNKWLKAMHLEHLIAFEPLTPDNSEKCSYGFDWEDIPSPEHCTWDYGKNICYPSSCCLNPNQLKIAEMYAEGRKIEDYYQKLDGD